MSGIDIIREMAYKTFIYICCKLPAINKIAIELRLRLTMGSRRKEIGKAFENITTKGVPLFYRVELETQNRCNGVCSFCPANKNADTRSYAKMTEELYEKIINELHELDYSGGLSLFCNNEPFLDTRLEDFAKTARELLPNAFIEVFSNGTVLKLDRFKKIIPYLDRLIIDNYNDKLKLNEPTKAIMAYLKENPGLKSKVSIHMRRETGLLSSRGGQAPNNKKKKALPISCLLPFYHLYIRPDGKIGLCCVDALYKHTLGDVSEQSLKEIWYSERYSDIRAAIRKGRENMEVCRFCDSFGNNIDMHHDDE